MPLVSVIVPNYNHAAYLSRRLESVLRQSLADIELIILDDASTDRSREVIKPYLADARVRFFPNQTNSGSPSAQWNRGVSLARGEYVWIAESDDFSDLEFLSVLTPLLEGSPRVGLAYCQSFAVDEQGTVIGDADSWTDDLAPGRWRAAFVAAGTDECARYLLWKNTIPNASAVLFRRGVFLRAGGAPPWMRLSGDWLTWVRMLLISDVAFTPRRLNYFRQHPATVRATTAQRQLSLERWAVRSLIARKCRLPRDPRRDLARMTFDELVWLVGAAPKGARLGTLGAGLRRTWPIIAGAPAFIGRRAWRRWFCGSKPDPQAGAR